MMVLSLSRLKHPSRLVPSALATGGCAAGSHDETRGFFVYA